jgi:hypothetical protein
MKVLLQDLRTLDYLGQDGNWTADADRAFDFLELVHALDFTLRHRLRHVRPVFKFDDANPDLELPPLHAPA